MNRSRSTASAVIAGASALAVAASSLMLTAPGVMAATAYDMPNPTVEYTVAPRGNATSTSGAYVWVNVNTALQTTVGSTVIGKEGAITFGTGQVASGRALTWYACPTRGAALTSCAAVRSTSEGVSASNSNSLYTPTAADTGKYLAYEVSQTFTVAGTSNTAKATSDRSKDLQVIGQLGTTARPAWGVNSVQAGGKASLLVFPWSLPTGSSFTARTITILACPNANQGQEAGSDWDETGCSIIGPGSITGSTVNANSAGVFQVQTTADMAGKSLIAEVRMALRAANGSASVFVVRSAAATLPGAAASAEPTASPSPTPAADAASTAPGATSTDSGSSASGPASATAVVPKVKIIAKKSIARGKATGMSIELTGRGKGTVGTGKAIVEVVKTGADGEKASQKLKTISIKGMKGFTKQTLSKKLGKGTYYIRVVYTDARSKVQAGALKKISVR